MSDLAAKWASEIMQYRDNSVEAWLREHATRLNLSDEDVYKRATVRWHHNPFTPIDGTPVTQKVELVVDGAVEATAQFVTQLSLEHGFSCRFEEVAL